MFFSFLSLVIALLSILPNKKSRAGRRLVLQQLDHLHFFEDSPLSVPSCQKVWLYRDINKMVSIEKGLSSSFHDLLKQ